MDERRLGVIGVVIDDPGRVQAELNRCISEANAIVVGRMGIPYRERNVAILALLVDGTTDQVNTLTGKLGALPGVSVRAALAKK